MEIVNNILGSKILRNDIYFKITFILWASMHSISFGQHITPYFSSLMILWGSAILGRKVLKKEISYKSFYGIISILFVITYIITILLNREINIIGNTKSLVWLILCLFILFLGNEKKSLEEIKDEIRKVSLAITIPTFLGTFIGLITFFFTINFRIVKGDGSGIPQGYYAARLWGIFQDPNEACNFAMIGLMASIIVIYLYKSRKNKLIVTFNIINIVVQYIYIVLSGSRGGAVGFAFILIGVIYIIIEKGLNKTKSKQCVRVIISVFLATTIGFSTLLLFSPTRKIVSQVPRYIAIIQNKINEEISEIEHVNNGDEVNREEIEVPNITTERPDVGTSNGRDELWLSGIELSKEALIFGHGDRNISERAKVSMPESRLAIQHVHNGYLHLLLSSGLVGLILMIILIGEVARKACITIVNKTSYTDEYFILSSLSVLCGGLLVSTIFLSEIFFQNSFTTLVFWSILGYIVSLNSKSKI